VGKGNGVDYRLFNLGGSVQLGTHIRKRGYVELRQDAGGRRRDSQSTKGIHSRLCDLSCASRSVGRRRRWRGRYARGWVSGADVKLLFGHPSDQGPRRLPVSVKSVRGHRPRRGLLSTFYFIFAE